MTAAQHRGWGGGAVPVTVARNLQELLGSDGGDFVRCAYWTLLQREPDPTGYEHYLSQLLLGTPKIRLLDEIAGSSEARERHVHLPGLAKARRWYRAGHVPLIGPLIRAFMDLDDESVPANRLRRIEQLLIAGVSGAKAGAAVDEAHPGNPAASDGAADAGSAGEFQRALPAADGTWEWRDYQTVKRRISEARAAQPGAGFAGAIDVLDTGKEPLASLAQRIVLPDPGSAPEISIILPVFNHLRLTLECLLSISRCSGTGPTYEVLVRDDASTDDTAAVVPGIAHLRYARNGKNLGFLRNCNQAIADVRGKFVVFINNDTQVSRDWLTILRGTFDRHPRVGVVGPRFVFPDGRLQEAGAALRPDGTAEMIGMGEDPAQPRFSYVRRVDYTSGACLMISAQLLRDLQGFSEEFLPCYCEDSDLCLRVQEKGYFVYYNPDVTIVHHLSRTTASINDDFKLKCVANNLQTLTAKWADRLERSCAPKIIAFYLPQFHPFPENNQWWGEGFTEWTNVTKATPNFVGHYQPRLPADLGFYDLRLDEVMAKQAELAARYGIEGFCFYYYWFAGKRLLERPIERMLASGSPDFPFCLCWANENWTRRWDGHDAEILVAQAYSREDDLKVIQDLARYFRDSRYIRVDGRPLILVYRVTSFPDFSQTAALWRKYCLDQDIGEIYIAMVESFELVRAANKPGVFGCDAAVEFPPQELAHATEPSGQVINPDFHGQTGDYRQLAVTFATRQAPDYTRFLGVMPGWDNTARMQDRSFCFEHATPGAFQAWIEAAIEQTRAQQYGDERLIFVNAWNEWAEGAYLEPDRRFGHAFLEAVRRAKDAALLMRMEKYALGN
jgi:GT2 family glycosyltransferase